MEAKVIEYNGHKYLVIHLYTDCYYGRKSVYHVLTDNQKWCGSIIPELCGFSKVESKGEHDLNYKRNPTMENALKPYYTVDFVEDKMYEEHYEGIKEEFGVDTDSYYVFTYKEPYDD